MTSPEPEVPVTSYEVSCVSEDHPYADHFTVKVRRDRHGWLVENRARTLGTDGMWADCYRGPFSDREPVTDEEREIYRTSWEAWIADHRFLEQTALRWAREAAPVLRLMGLTADEVLEWEATR